MVGILLGKLIWIPYTSETETDLFYGMFYDHLSAQQRHIEYNNLAIHNRARITSIYTGIEQ